MEKVRDRLWIFTCVAGSDNNYLEAGGITTGSRMTPAESAFYLDVPNLMMVRWKGLPAPPYDQYAYSFRPLKQVFWSIVGSGGSKEEDELSPLLDAASHFPNITGVMMDDFFTGEGKGQLNVDDLKNIRGRLDVNGRRLDLCVVLYTHQLDLPVAPYIDQTDIVSLWTWNADHLSDLERNMERTRQLKPDGRIFLGCYLWDYPNARPVPSNLMERQCELGLQWLKNGEIEGIVFLGNTVCDLNLEVVEWTRDWIKKEGNTPIVR